MISGPIAPGKSSRSSTRSGFTVVVSGTAKSMDLPYVAFAVGVPNVASAARVTPARDGSRSMAATRAASSGRPRRAARIAAARVAARIMASTPRPGPASLRIPVPVWLAPSRPSRTRENEVP